MTFGTGGPSTTTRKLKVTLFPTSSAPSLEDKRPASILTLELFELHFAPSAKR